MESNAHNHTALRLVELSGSDFEISDHQPDITSWTIIDKNATEIGEVNDLIFDKETNKVRYIVALIDLKEEEGTRSVLIPIGIVDLDEKEENVILSKHDAASLVSLPTYKSGTVISPAEELAVRYTFLGKEGLTNENDDSYQAHPEDFYAHEHFNDEKFKKGNL